MTKEKKTAIVLIDIQGRLAEIMYENDKLFKNLQILIKGAQLLSIPIIWTEQLPEKLGRTTKRISDLLINQKPIIKSEFSSVKNEEFSDTIKNKKYNHFLISGIETHVCVYQSAKDLLNLGHEVELIVDATSSRAELNRNIGIEKIISLGGKVTTVEMLLFEKQKIALGDKFRELIKIVK
ncbi:MAG: isochorismatase family protein [Planctomycetia bacterium]|nr:isochorismatase family protein [Planctomycetia bacterium]